MAAQPSGLDANQERIVQQAVSALLTAGLEHMTVRELAQRFGVNQETAGTWRNIRYGVQGERRLPIKDCPRGRNVGGIHFGARFAVLDVQRLGDEIWLKLAESTWVLAKNKNVTNCIDMKTWKEHAGPIPEDAFTGQKYPHDGMYTEGFPGSSPICLVSASGDGFWREINIEMLHRDIATSTVFEAQWGGSADFTTWTAYYAANVVLFTEVRGLHPKRFIVTVKPSKDWRKYLEGRCTGPQLQSVKEDQSIKEDIGKAQYAECNWLFDNRERLDLDWSTVVFITSLGFLRNHCQWSRADCQKCAEKKLQRLLEAFDTMDADKRAYQFDVAFWCLDEAFDGQELSAEAGMMLSKILLGKIRIVWPLAGAMAQAWQKLVDSPSVYGTSVLAALAEPGDAGHHALLAILQLGQAAAPLAGAMREGRRHAEERARNAAREVLEGLGITVDEPMVTQSALSPSTSAPNPSTTARGASWVDGLLGMFTGSQKIGTWQTLPDMPTKRSWLAAVASEGCVYVLGGSSGAYLSTVERFDPSAGAWEALARMPTVRTHLAAAALGGRVYALGGRDEGGRVLATNERFDPEASA